MKGWNTITKTAPGVWALHLSDHAVGMAEAVVYYYEKNGNYVCDLCRPNQFCHHIEAVLKLGSN